MINLIHGEALEQMAKMEDKSVDCCITDLPYGRTRNKWDSQIPMSEMWKEVKRVVKDDGAIVLFADGMFMADLMKSGKDIWRYNLVWNKVMPTGFLNANRMPLRVHEEMCVFYQRPPKYNPQKVRGKRSHSRGKEKEFQNNNYNKFSFVETRDDSDMKFPKSIVTVPKVHPSKTTHPTQKPVELIEWLIKTYTSVGETVLDFTMGSGTTMIACINTGRNGVGIEIQEKYFAAASNAVRKLEKRKEKSNE